MDLIIIWAAILVFVVFLYVVLDGFDLGVGILFPLFTEHQRDLVINSIAPIWDGNETWLVMGGGCLFAVFPLAYAVLMPAIYVPLIAMLLGLVFRGVAFEFRGRTKRWRSVWDIGFHLGSLVATFAQGMIVGTIIQGIPIENRQYAGDWLHWLSPFSLVTGAAVVFGYVLMGSSWLVIKTDGDLREKAQRYTLIALWLTLAAFAMVSLWTPWLAPNYFQRWFSWPGWIFTISIPVLVGLTTLWLRYDIRHGVGIQAFLASIFLFATGMSGILVNLYPNLLPPDLSFQAAAAPSSSLKFALVGTVILIPVILSYTAYNYWVFRGRVKPDDAYH